MYLKISTKLISPLNQHLLLLPVSFICDHLFLSFFFVLGYHFPIKAWGLNIGPLYELYHYPLSLRQDFIESLNCPGQFAICNLLASISQVAKVKFMSHYAQLLFLSNVQTFLEINPLYFLWVQGSFFLQECFKKCRQDTNCSP